MKKYVSLFGFILGTVLNLSGQSVSEYRVKELITNYFVSPKIISSDNLSFLLSENLIDNQEFKRRKSRKRKAMESDMYVVGSPSFNIPTGKMADRNNAGFGLNVGYGYKFTENFSAFVLVGYQIFSGKTFRQTQYDPITGAPLQTLTYEYPKLSLIPIEAAGRYFPFTEDWKPYIQMSFGISLLTQDESSTEKYIRLATGLLYGSSIVYGVEASLLNHYSSNIGHSVTMISAVVMFPLN
jgi:hypothetical protein